MHSDLIPLNMFNYDDLYLNIGKVFWNENEFRNPYFGLTNDITSDNTTRNEIRIIVKKNRGAYEGLKSWIFDCTLYIE